MTRRLLLLVPKPEGASSADFAASVVEMIGRPLSRRAACTVYVPDDALDAVKSPFPKAASFDALVDVAEPQDAAAAPLAWLGDVTARPGVAVYRAEERRLKRHVRDWPDEQTSPGLTLVSTVRRSAVLDAAAFDAHWRDVHGPLALRHHAGMWDYRQSVVFARLSDVAPELDGVARLAFPTLEAFETQFFDSREGRKAIGADTLRFVDVEQTEIRLLREVVLSS